MSKIACIKQKVHLDRRDLERGNVHYHLTQALPFYRSKLGCLIHRVRSGRVHMRGHQYSHTSITFWCGNSGFLGTNHPGALLYSEPPEGQFHCALCEGKATGAGLNGARVIAGRQVLFRPRF